MFERPRTKAEIESQLQENAELMKDNAQEEAAAGRDHLVAEVEKIAQLKAQIERLKGKHEETHDDDIGEQLSYKMDELRHHEEYVAQLEEHFRLVGEDEEIAEYVIKASKEEYKKHLQ